MIGAGFIAITPLKKGEVPHEAGYLARFFIS
jgi:hypothetical protein